MRHLLFHRWRVIITSQRAYRILTPSKSSISGRFAIHHISQFSAYIWLPAALLSQEPHTAHKAGSVFIARCRRPADRRITTAAVAPVCLTEYTRHAHHSRVREFDLTNYETATYM